MFLNPCPFCGSFDVVILRLPRRGRQVKRVRAKCNACRALGPPVPYNGLGPADRCARAWNDRDVAIITTEGER